MAQRSSSGQSAVCNGPYLRGGYSGHDYHSTPRPASVRPKYPERATANKATYCPL